MTSRLLLRFFITLGNVLPPSRDLLYRISKLPGYYLAHTTCTLLPDTAIAGLNEVPALLLKFFIILGNVLPPSIDLLYKISKFPDVSSSHTTCTLLPDTAIAGREKFQHYYLDSLWVL